MNEREEAAVMGEGVHMARMSFPEPVRPSVPMMAVAMEAALAVLKPEAGSMSTADGLGGVYCKHCLGSREGWREVNPDWPNGDGPATERTGEPCPHCVPGYKDETEESLDRR